MTQRAILERKLTLKRQYRKLFLEQIDSAIQELENQIEIAKRSESLLSGWAINEQ